MARPAPAEMKLAVSWWRLIMRVSCWSGLLVGGWVLALLLLQVLFGRQLERVQTVQLGRELALLSLIHI